ncbi:hypothetical protein [Paenibacillus taiwanensis]|uniref:hypothetical protein n=1 Tax=Paenibacillus taiwanensis TaxID=401638 RepID=UPI0004171DC5|nr:hypothetical protein [Paenibacillus taiwanensis]
MKKRRRIFTASLVLTLVLGTGAYAAAAWMNGDMTSKADRMFHMSEMYAERTENEIGQMRKSCHEQLERHRETRDGSMRSDRMNMSHRMGQM